MKKIILALQTGLIMLLPFTAMSHPGHGETEGYTITHYFTEPVHATVSILLMAGVIFTMRYVSRKKSVDKKA